MGELARKPGAPKFSETPMELLTLREGEGFSFIDTYAVPFGLAATGVLTIFLANKTLMRPVWAGIHMYLLAGAGGYGAGILWRNFRMTSQSEDVAVLKHYVSLHPEDFPPFERRRIKDVFKPWHPIR